MRLAGGSEAPEMGMKSLPEVRRLVRQQFVPVVGIEVVPLAVARNRALATNLVASVDLPPHDNAAMDGFAIRSVDQLAAGIPRLRLVGHAAAGHPFDGEVADGQAVRILTGAPLPRGADTVVTQETCGYDGDHLRLIERVRPGANIRRRGEDVRAGSVVLAAGRRLRPHDIALAAALGVQELAVFQQLRVALFSTGDEVREPGAPLDTGQLWDANRWLLRSVLGATGCVATDPGS